MSRFFKTKWLYIICITLFIAFAVALVPPIFRAAHSFEMTAMLVSVALYIATAVIASFILAFIVNMLIKRHRHKKEIKSLH